MLRRTAAFDEPSALEHMKVLGNRLDRDRKRSCQLVHRRLALDQASKNRAPRRVGEGCKRRAELIGRQLFILSVEQPLG
jgi:hypothetical protein